MAVQPLASQVGVAPACRALGVPRASFYRRQRPAPGHQQPRRRCHVNHRVTSLWAPTPEIMQRSSLAATVSSRRRGIGGVFGGRPDGVGR